MDIRIETPLDAKKVSTSLLEISLCGSGAIVGESKSAQRTYVLPLLCKNWSCPRCAPVLRRHWVTVIAAGHPTRWFRLGCRRDFPGGPDAAAKLMTSAWARASQIIRRRWGHFEYVRVLEQCQDGFPHFHIAYRGNFIARQWLSALWRNLVGAPNVDIKKLWDHQGAARYIAKEMTSATKGQTPPTSWGRRITKSRHWLPEDATAEASDLPADTIWNHDPAPLHQVIYELSQFMTLVAWDERRCFAVFAHPPEPLKSAEPSIDRYDQNEFYDSPAQDRRLPAFI